MRVIKPYLLWQYPKMEKWLASMASEGWRLERVNGWAFHFRQMEPRQVRFSFFYDEPRAGRLLETKLTLQRLHGEPIRTGWFDPDVMRMSPQTAARKDWFEARRSGHMRCFGTQALFFSLLVIAMTCALLLTKAPMQEEDTFLLLLTTVCLMDLIQTIPAWVMEWRRMQ